jgi:DNA polymerase-3 subunit delta'
MRRERMMTLLEVAAGRSRYSSWIKHSESISASKSEKLELYLRVLYGLLEDVLLTRTGLPARQNTDLQARLSALASATSFDWLRKITAQTDELVEFSRRNVQKGLALDSLAMLTR